MRDTEGASAIVLQSQRQRMEAVWRQRAQRLSQRPDLAENAQNTFPVVVLGIGKERYGVDLQDVAEVFPPVAPTPVPGAAAVISGVINVHGTIRPVVDLRRLLDMKSDANTLRDGYLAHVILLHKDGREMGLQIDSVEQIRWIETADLQMATRSDAGAFPRISHHIKGSTKDLLMLLSTEAIFAALDVTEPHQTDPHQADPHQADPHQADPHQADPHQAELNTE
jgi:purine-binding chemotaxis protein CheW